MHHRSLPSAAPSGRPSVQGQGQDGAWVEDQTTEAQPVGGTIDASAKVMMPNTNQKQQQQLVKCGSSGQELHYGSAVPTLEQSHGLSRSDPLQLSHGLSRSDPLLMPQAKAAGESQSAEAAGQE